MQGKQGGEGRGGERKEKKKKGAGSECRTGSFESRATYPKSDNRLTTTIPSAAQAKEPAVEGGINYDH